MMSFPHKRLDSGLPTPPSSSIMWSSNPVPNNGSRDQSDPSWLVVDPPTSPPTHEPRRNDTDSSTRTLQPDDSASNAPPLRSPKPQRAMPMRPAHGHAHNDNTSPTEYSQVTLHDPNAGLYASPTPMHAPSPYPVPVSARSSENASPASTGTIHINREDSIAERLEENAQQRRTQSWETEQRNKRHQQNMHPQQYAGGAGGQGPPGQGPPPPPANDPPGDDSDDDEESNKARYEAWKRQQKEERRQRQAQGQQLAWQPQNGPPTVTNPQFYSGDPRYGMGGHMPQPYGLPVQRQGQFAVKPGHRYGNITALGNARVVRGNVIDSRFGPNPLERQHDYGDAFFADNANVLDGNVTQEQMKDFWNSNK